MSKMRWILNFISPSTGKRYSLLEKVDGSLWCTCLGCRYNPYHSCKHIESFIQFGRVQ